ncbi:MAG: SafA/ExsA family spore coat assembly protein [Clostridia bacterium]|nr:SafA/ExsA family spore coat assembly protein [Clostridia bacterium]
MGSFAQKDPLFLFSPNSKREAVYCLKKLVTLLISVFALLFVFSIGAFAMGTHTVAKGDSLWKIAVKYQVGLSEIKAANPQIKNYDLIYPGDLINIPSKDATVSSYESEVVRLVNIERQKNGLSPLKEDWQLSRVARYKSEDMRDRGYFSHTSPTYGSPFDMMRAFGISYRSAGENIAKGQQSPEAVVRAWMNSSGHRANILSKSFTHIGVGYAKQGHYWTQMFISK